MNNTIKLLCITGAAALALAITSAAGLGTAAAQAPAATAQEAEVPLYDVDPSFFKLPNGWHFASVSSVACDSHDNVWVLQRSYSVYSDQKTGPSVMEFNPQGNYIKGWGGQGYGEGKGFQWPEEEHGISVDNKDDVWITGNWNDDQIYEFTTDGKLIKQFGNSAGGYKKTNADTSDFWMPAAAVVYPKTNELFVADGYGNNRVIVVDATTGAFKRMWGAFGNPPQDIPPRAHDIRRDTQAATTTRFGGAEQFRTEYFLNGGKEHPNETIAGQPPYPKAPHLDPSDPGPPQFNLVHDLKVSNDGLVYVADRRNMRVQVFTIEGKFLKSVWVDRWCSYGCSGNTQTAGSVAFSGDPEQRFLIVGSRTPAQIWIYDRKTMEPLYAFGRPGTEPGEFLSFHELTTDSKGNIFTADLEGHRAEKFVFKGLAKRAVDGKGNLVDIGTLLHVR